MTSTPRLFDLMPRLYRRRDAETGGQMEAVFDVLQRQRDLLQADIAALYDNWFVETCEPWLLPYIADLVATGRLSRRAHPRINTRAIVAKTLAHRRRKGVASTLEEVLTYATGWPVRVVDPAGRLVIAPSLRAPSTARAALPNLKDQHALSRIAGPFDRVARLARGDSGSLRPDTVEVLLWSQQTAPLRDAEAGVAAGGRGRRTFHGLGLDRPLFNPPIRLDPRVGERLREMPFPISRLDLDRDLKSNGTLFGWLTQVPAFVIRLNGIALDASDLAVADLSKWRTPPRRKARVFVDPERGRILLTRSADHDARMATDHDYGLSADLGGGGYAREAAPNAEDQRQWPGWATAPTLVANSAALADGLELAPDLGVGCLLLAGSNLFEPPAARRKQPGWRVALGARKLVLDAADGEQPCLRGDLLVSGERPGGVLILAGLTIGGTIRISGDLTLVLRDVTVIGQEGEPAVVSEPGAVCSIVLERTLAAGLRLGPNVHLTARDSILAAPHSGAEAQPGTAVEGQAAARLSRCTLDGPAHLRRLDARDTLFTAPPIVQELRHGGIEHCWLPAGAQTPPRRACLSSAPAGEPETRHAAPPPFISRRLCQPGYLRWLPGTSNALDTGASDGQAIGAYHAEGQALRRDNYVDALAEHLPFHLRVVTTFVT